MFKGIRLSDDPAQSSQPVRKRWGKRLAWAFLIFVIAIVVAQAIWSYRESSKLNQRIEAIRAAGEPILPSDFGSNNTDAPDNAVTDLVAAAGMLQRNDQTWKDFQNLELALPLRPREVASIDPILTRSQPALERLTQAQTKPKSNWPVDVSDQNNILDTMLPDLGAIRGLANVLGDGALLEHQRGEDQSAIHHLSQIFFIARVLDRNPTLVGHLVSIGCRALASQRLMEISSDLRIGPGERDATPQQIREIIAILLEQKSIHDGYVWSMQGERMLQQTMVQNLLSGAPMSDARAAGGEPPRGWSPVSRYAARPLIYHNARLMLDQMARIIPLADAPDWQTAQKQIPPRINGPLPLVFLAQILTPSLGRAVATQFRVIVEQHLAATTLAIRCYAVDHNGQLPSNLDELVPNYLAAIPTDLLAAGAPPLKYLPHQPDPILYSVGEDGFDDGGSEASQRAGHPAVSEWDMKDRVIHLLRQPRPAPETDSDGPSNAP